MRYQVKVHDEDDPGAGPGHVFTFDTRAEAQAFHEGVMWVNDSALTIAEKPEPIPAPEPVAHHPPLRKETR